MEKMQYQIFVGGIPQAFLTSLGNDKI